MDNDYKCKQCYFYNGCRGRRICKHFYPLDDDIENEFMADIADEERNYYRKAWLSYTADFEG